MNGFYNARKFFRQNKFQFSYNNSVGQRLSQIQPKLIRMLISLKDREDKFQAPIKFQIFKYINLLQDLLNCKAANLDFVSRKSEI